MSKQMSLEDLKGRAGAINERISKRQKRLYRYARDKGFSSSEAVILQNRTTELIDKLALERAQNG